MKLGKLVSQVLNEGRGTSKSNYDMETMGSEKVKPVWNGKGKHPDMIPAQKIDGKRKGTVNWSAAGEEPHHSSWMEVDGIRYVFVDGPFVRANFHIDFVEGGHHYRYEFIPEDEIWIEDEMSQIDTVAVGIHETIERRLMKNFGWSYDDGHDAASNIERKFRDIIMRKGTYIPDYEKIKKMFAEIMKGKEKLVFSIDKGVSGRTGDDKVLEIPEKEFQKSLKKSGVK